MTRGKQKPKTQPKSRTGHRAKTALLIYILSIVFCILFTAYSPTRNWPLTLLTMYIIPPAALLYILYLFRPTKTDKLGISLWFIFGSIVIAIISCVIVFFCFYNHVRD